MDRNYDGGWSWAELPRGRLHKGNSGAGAGEESGEWKAVARGRGPGREAQAGEAAERGREVVGRIGGASQNGQGGGKKNNYDMEH